MIVFRSLSAPVQISHIKIKIKMVALMLAMSHSTKSELGALHFEGAPTNAQLIASQMV